MEYITDKELLNKLELLVELIKKSTPYRDYLELKKDLSSNEDIKEKIIKIKKLQQQYVKSAFLDEEKEQERQKLLTSLEQIPLYEVYQEKKEELDFYLEPMIEELNKTLQSFLD